MLYDDDILLPVSLDDSLSEKGYFQPIYSDSYIKLLNYISSFNQLEDDWDGYGAISPSPDAINNAKKFIMLLAKMMRDRLLIDGISVTPYGTIVLEWINDNNDLLNLEIGNSKIGLITDINDESKILLNGIGFDFDKDGLPSAFVEAFFKLF